MYTCSLHLDHMLDKPLNPSQRLQLSMLQLLPKHTQRQGAKAQMYVTMEAGVDKI